MPNIIARIAIIGRFELLPGILPVLIGANREKFFVSHGFPSVLGIQNTNISVDTTDCTVFTVTPEDDSAIDIEKWEDMEALLYKSLAVVSEIAVWAKANDEIGKLTSFFRQVGITDIKCFFADNGVDVVGYISPLFKMDRPSLNIIAGFLPNSIISNGPAASPVPEITKRILSSLDLVHLGFYTESFINLFALVDDLIQRIIKTGLTQAGLSKNQQKKIFEKIEDDRLGCFLGTLAKKYGWKSLPEENSILYGRLKEVNTARNYAVHSDRRLSITEAVDFLEVLLEVFEWLRTNPYGFALPIIPSTSLIHPEFFKMPFPAARERSDTSSDSPNGVRSSLDGEATA